MLASGLDSILSNTDTLLMIIMGGLGFVWIVLGTIGGVIRGVARERTRREIAAYIAEGSMTPEEGERLIKAGPQKTRGCRSC